MIYAESCENLQNWKYPIFQVFWPQRSLLKGLLVLDLISFNSLVKQIIWTSSKRVHILPMSENMKNG
jgi:hypothetical protein